MVTEAWLHGWVPHGTKVPVHPSSPGPDLSGASSHMTTFFDQSVRDGSPEHPSFHEEKWLPYSHGQNWRRHTQNKSKDQFISSCQVASPWSRHFSRVNLHIFPYPQSMFHKISPSYIPKISPYFSPYFSYNKNSSYFPAIFQPHLQQDPPLEAPVPQGSALRWATGLDGDRIACDSPAIFNGGFFHKKMGEVP